MQQHDKIMDPREQLLQDLSKAICSAHDDGTQVILMGDFNKDMKNGSRIAQFLEDSNMYNAHKIKHEKNKIPVIYNRGHLCLDMIAASISIPIKAIIKCDILPFYSVFRQFTTDKVKRENKYMFELETRLEEARMFHKVNELEKLFKEHLQHQNQNLHLLIDQCKRRFSKTKEVMKASEK